MNGPTALNQRIVMGLLLIAAASHVSALGEGDDVWSQLPRTSTETKTSRRHSNSSAP
jgi:hypothetical protein